MRKYMGVLMVVLLAIMMVGCNKADKPKGEDANTPSDIVEKAEQFIRFLSEGNYEEATERFNDAMKDALTPTALEELWGTLNEQAGKFIDQEYDSTEQNDEHETVLINGLFEGIDVIFFVTFDEEEQIAGFYIK